MGGGRYAMRSGAEDDLLGGLASPFSSLFIVLFLPFLPSGCVLPSRLGLLRFVFVSPLKFVIGKVWLGSTGGEL